MSDPDGDPVAECTECGLPVPATVSEKVQWGSEESFTADRLNRIARGAPERGDVERACVHPELDGPCSGCAERRDDEPLRCTCDYAGMPGEPHKRFCEQEYGPHAQCATRIEWLEEQLAAGSLPAMPPEVTEALTHLRDDLDARETWFRLARTPAERSAASVVRWAMSLPGTGERAATEQDDRSPATGCGCCDDPSDELGFKGGMCGRCGHPFGDHEYDPSPRSWSLPALPPDDVTVVHVDAAPNHLLYRADGSGTVWESKRLGKFFRWSQMLGEGTVVEGESQAAEPPDDVTTHVEWGTVGTDEDGDEGIETFESMDEAVAAAKRWRARGMTNVYVERHDVTTSRAVSTTTRTTDWKADE